MKSSLATKTLSQLRNSSGTAQEQQGKYKTHRTYVHDAAEEHGAESDINVRPLLAEAVEDLEAHVGVGRDKVVVADNACACCRHIVVGCRLRAVRAELISRL